MFAAKLILCLVLCQQPESSLAGPSAQGIFEGPLKVGAIELRLAFHLKKKDDGKWTALMDSPDQGATGIPMTTATVEGNQVVLEFKPGQAKLTGTLSADGQTLDATWEQAGSRFPLTLKRVAKVTERKRPQEPKPPFPYRTEDVKYPNAKAKGVTLAGTLTLPRGNGPFPAVILISGSGPQDRNEELLGHKPFLVLADHLTRRGIAVLRFDDRGVGKSTGNHAKATSADFATDVEAAIDFLKTRAEIDPQRIGLMGHSEGGLIAPMVAVARPDVAFIVLLAGPGLPGDEILRLQSNLIAKKMGSSDKELGHNRKFLERAFVLLKEEADDAKVLAALKAELAKLMAELPPEERAEALAKLRKDHAGKSDEELEKLAREMGEAGLPRLANPWMRFFISFDPRPTLAKVKCPVLAVNGELDLQVPVDENLQAIEQALRAGGNPDFTCKKFPGLNHLFQNTKTGLPSEYGTLEETFCPKALEFIGDWIRSKAGVSSSPDAKASPVR